MGVRIIQELDSSRMVWYDSVTGWAFGPVFSCSEEEEEFSKYLDEHCLYENDQPKDARALSEQELRDYWDKFISERQT